MDDETGEEEPREHMLKFLKILLMMVPVTASWALPAEKQEDARTVPSFATGSVIREFTFYTPRSGPSIVMSDREDNVYVAMARAGKIGRFSKGTLREYDLPPQSFPVGLAIDPSGNVWFSDIRRNKIGRLDVTTGMVKDYAVPTPDSWPFFIGVHPDGHLWFTERMGNNIGKLDPVTGQMEEFHVPTEHCQPAGLTITPQGQIFFTENSGDKLGHIDPATGKLTEHPVPTPSTPSPYYGLAGVASDAQGNIWFAEVDGRLGHLGRGATKIEEVPLPERSVRPAGVTVDGWGIVWVTELDGNHITSYNPYLREFRRYPVPTGSPDPKPMGPPEATARGEMPTPGAAAKTSRPFGIAVDSRGRVWFSEQYAHKVGVLEPPSVEIFQPAGALSAEDAKPKIQLRTSANARLQYWIDGREVAPAKLMDTAMSAPGGHELVVVESRSSGVPFVARSTFVVNPTLASLHQLANRLDERLRHTAVEALVKAKSSAGSGDTQAGRRAVRALLGQLAEKSATASEKEFLESLRYFDLFGVREYDVALDGAALQPRRIEIEVGDVIRWHAGGVAPLQITTSSGDFQSPLLQAGETWIHVFSREGVYRYSAGPERGEQSGEVVVRPRTTMIREYPMLGAGRVPGVLSADFHDQIWFTAGGGGFLNFTSIPLNNRIGVLRRDGTIVEYQTPTLESGPTSVVAAHNDRVYFTERAGNKIGELNPETGAVREFPLPTNLSAVTGIAAAPNGDIWFTEKLSSKVGRLDTSTGKIDEFNTPSPRSEPSTVMVDANGNVWFDERANDKIVRLVPALGTTTEFTVPTKGSRVVGLVPDPRGYVWFLELGAHKVGRLDVSTGMVLEFSIPTPYCSPFKLALDSLGRVWFTEVFGNKLAVLDQERFYEFALPEGNSMPGGITIDSRGNVWFSEQAGNKIGVVPGGALLQFSGRTPATTPNRVPHLAATVAKSTQIN
jgi:virginiamycin B lyase